jgi:hypothetical protein
MKPMRCMVVSGDGLKRRLYDICAIARQAHLIAQHHLCQEKRVMTKLINAARLAGITVALLASPALELRATEPDSGVREGEPVKTELSPNASATTYWLAEADGWHVVSTIDIVLEPDSVAEQHAVARFSAVLLPGQAEVISVPYALGEQQQVLRIRRLDDRIEIARVPGSSV